MAVIFVELPGCTVWEFKRLLSALNRSDIDFNLLSKEIKTYPIILKILVKCEEKEENYKEIIKN